MSKRGVVIKGAPAWPIALAVFVLGLAGLVASIGVLIRAWDWAF